MVNKNYYIAVVCFLVMCALVLSLVLIPRNVVSVNAKNLDITAKGMCVIESTTKRVLNEKDKNAELPMASTTKIMTALIALENTSDLDTPFTVDERAVGIEGTSIYLRKDEKLCMRELLYGLMLASGNDAAMAIAYKVGGGDLTKFVDLMNQKAQELNLHNTHFDNPHGLDSKTHYTSAYDLAVITAKAMESKTFCEIVSTQIKQISPTIDGENRFLRNKHKLLWLMDGCNGVKTGFTDNARRCCVTSAERDGMHLICVVLNCNDMFEESQKVLEKAFSEYKMTDVILPNRFIKSVSVENGEAESVKCYIQKGLKYPLKDGEIDFVRTETEIPAKLTAPIKKDAEIGTNKVYLDNNLIFSEKIYTIEEVPENSVKNKVKDIIEKWYYE